jgi:hypothetical protein
MKSHKEDDNIPKWTNFICPSCGIAYGINTLIKAIKKRQQKKEEHTTQAQT